MRLRALLLRAGGQRRAVVQPQQDKHCARLESESALAKTAAEALDDEQKSTQHALSPRILALLSSRPAAPADGQQKCKCELSQRVVSIIRRTLLLLPLMLVPSNTLQLSVDMRQLRDL